VKIITESKKVGGSEYTQHRDKGAWVGVKRERKVWRRNGGPTPGYTEVCITGEESWRKAKGGGWNGRWGPGTLVAKKVAVLQHNRLITTMVQYNKTANSAKLNIPREGALRGLQDMGKIQIEVSRG